MLRAITGGCSLSVRVNPGARETAIIGTYGEALKISVAVPAAEGRANAALVAFLAERLRIPQRSIVIVSGVASRTKIIRITGVTPAEAKDRLLSDLA